MKALYRLILTSCLALAAVTPAYSLTLDPFDGEQVVVSSSGNQLNSSTVPVAAIGGLRRIETQLIQGRENGCYVQDGYLSYVQSPFSQGQTVIIWDGNAQSGFDPTGLGGIDLSQDESNAFLLKINSFDFPFQKAITLRITVYDIATPDGSAWSSATVVLDRPYTSADAALTIPFSQFTTYGSAPANFSQVGAIALTIEGVSDLGLVIDSFATNGSCHLIPGKLRVVDDCGVCGGNGIICRCTTISRKRERKVIRQQSNRVYRSIVQETGRAIQCSGALYEKLLSSAKTTLDALLLELDTNIAESELSCPSTFCTQVSREVSIQNLRRTARDLRSIHSRARNRANAACGYPSDKAWTVQNSFRKLFGEISKLPVSITSCG